MTQAALYQPRKSSPTALTVVVLLHGAALTALAMSKVEFVASERPPTQVELIEMDKVPPENKPEKVEREIQPPQKEIVFIPPREIETTQTADIFESTTAELKPVVIVPDPGPAVDPAPKQETLPPPPPRKIQAARAKANLASYVSDADYPAAAIRSGDEGTTQFTLSVGPDGRVTGCTVTGSSGSSALDSATCRIMKSRARFQPAKDADGRPTTDSVSNRIRWVLPDE